MVSWTTCGTSVIMGISVRSRFLVSWSNGQAAPSIVRLPINFPVNCAKLFPEFFLEGPSTEAVIGFRELLVLEKARLHGDVFASEVPHQMTAAECLCSARQESAS